jgi:hypothetical protein
MQNVSEQVSREEWECLPNCAWLFLAVAFVPHLIAMAGQHLLTKLASSICFPVSMGPFAFVHSYIVDNRLGFDSHMAWISALLFSMAWFPIFRWSWSKDKTKTIVLCALCFIVFSGWAWLLILP